MTGHADVLLGFLKEQDARDHWEKWNDSPLPKLLGHFAYASNVDGDASKRGEKCFWTKHRQVPYDGHYPVPVRVVNVSEIAGYLSEDLKNAYSNSDLAVRHHIEHSEARLAETMLKDLHVLNVNASRSVHRTDKDGQNIIQLLIMLPRTKLEGDPANPQEIPDFEGAVTLLAYLLHKGYVTQKDFPPGEASSTQQNLTQAFDRTLLKFAESAHYQNKVRAALGESLLPDEKHGQDRGSRLV